MAPDDHSGARPAGPVVLRIKLRYDDLDAMVQRFAPNVGKSGLFLPTKSIQPIGTEVKFELRLSNDTPALVGIGRVKHVKPPDPAHPKAAFGMAIELMRVSREGREVIIRMIERRRAMGLPDVAIPVPEDVEAARRGEVDSQPRADTSGIVREAMANFASAPVAEAVLSSPPSGPIAVAKEPSLPLVAPVLTDSGPVKVEKAESGPVKVESTPTAESTPKTESTPKPPTAPPPRRREPSAAPLLTSARDLGPISREAMKSVPVLAPEPPRAKRPRVADLIAKAAELSGPLSTSVPDLDDQHVDVERALVRARTLAGGDLDAELAAVRESAAAPLEISIEAASAELARQLGGNAIARRDRSARWAPPPAIESRPTAIPSDDQPGDASSAKDGASDATSERTSDASSERTTDAASSDERRDAVTSGDGARDAAASTRERDGAAADPSASAVFAEKTRAPTEAGAAAVIAAVIDKAVESAPPADPTPIVEPSHEERLADDDDAFAANASTTTAVEPEVLATAGATKSRVASEPAIPIDDADLIASTSTPRLLIEDGADPSSFARAYSEGEALNTGDIIALDPDELIEDDGEDRGESTMIGALPVDPASVDPQAFAAHGYPTMPDAQSEQLADQLDRHLDDAEAEADAEFAQGMHAEYPRAASAGQAGQASYAGDAGDADEEISDGDVLAEADEDDADLLSADGEGDASRSHDAAPAYEAPAGYEPSDAQQGYAQPGYDPQAYAEGGAGEQQGYPSQGEYAQQPGYPSQGEYAQQPGYPAQGEYAEQPGYPAQADYAEQQGDYAQRGYATQGDFAQQDAQGEYAQHGAQDGYAQPDYDAQGEQPGYPAQGAYAQQPDYDAQAGYAQQPGYNQEADYARQDSAAGYPQQLGADYARQDAAGYPQQGGGDYARPDSAAGYQQRGADYDAGYPQQVGADYARQDSAAGYPHESGYDAQPPAVPPLDEESDYGLDISGFPPGEPIPDPDPQFDDFRAARPAQEAVERPSFVSRLDLGDDDDIAPEDEFNDERPGNRHASYSEARPARGQRPPSVGDFDAPSSSYTFAEKFPLAGLHPPESDLDRALAEAEAEDGLDDSPAAGYPAAPADASDSGELLSPPTRGRSGSESGEVISSRGRRRSDSVSGEVIAPSPRNRSDSDSGELIAPATRGRRDSDSGELIAPATRGRASGSESAPRGRRDSDSGELISPPTRGRGGSESGEAVAAPSRGGGRSRPDSDSGELLVPPTHARTGDDAARARRDSASGGFDTSRAQRDAVTGGHATPRAQRDSVTGGHETSRARRDSVTGGHETSRARRSSSSGGIQRPHSASGRYEAVDPEYDAPASRQAYDEQAPRARRESAAARPTSQTPPGPMKLDPPTDRPGEPRILQQTPEDLEDALAALDVDDMSLEQERARMRRSSSSQRPLPGLPIHRPTTGPTPTVPKTPTGQVPTQQAPRTTQTTGPVRTVAHTVPRTATPPHATPAPPAPRQTGASRTVPPPVPTAAVKKPPTQQVPVTPAPRASTEDGVLIDFDDDE